MINVGMVVFAIALFLTGVKVGIVGVLWLSNHKRKFAAEIEENIYQQNRQCFFDLYTEYEASLKNLQEEFKSNLMKEMEGYGTVTHTSHMADAGYPTDEENSEPPIISKKKNKTELH